MNTRSQLFLIWHVQGNNISYITLVKVVLLLLDSRTDKVTVLLLPFVLVTIIAETKINLIFRSSDQFSDSDSPLNFSPAVKKVKKYLVVNICTEENILIS